MRVMVHIKDVLKSGNNMEGMPCIYNHQSYPFIFPQLTQKNLDHFHHYNNFIFVMKIKGDLFQLFFSFLFIHC